MSLTISLMCDKCERKTYPQDQTKPPAVRIKHYGEGWTRLNGGVDLCPSCNGSSPDYWESDPF